MGKCVCMGAQLKCSFGAVPGVFSVLPAKRTNAENKPAATIMDNIPMANIAPFGTCSAPTNPAVIAAFGAPQPCIPVTAAPWIPGSPKVMIGGVPALDDSCKLMCTWLGIIEITNPGTQKTNVG